MRWNRNSLQKYMLLLLAVVMLPLLQGCGVDPVPEWQIQADVMAFAPEWDPAATINSFSILRRVSNEEEKTEEIQVKLDGQTNTVHAMRYYTVSYFYEKGDGWTFSDIEVDNTDLWETKPLVGPNVALAQEVLMGKMLYVGDDTWVINEETLQDVRIENESFEKGETEATMYCTVILENEYVKVTGSASVLCQYNGTYTDEAEEEDAGQKPGWYVTSCAVGDDYTYRYRSDIDPEVTVDSVMNMLDKRRFKFGKTWGNYQYVWMQRDNIRDLVLETSYPTKKGENCICKGQFTYATELATFDVTYLIKLSYDLETANWTYVPDEIEYTAECVDVKLPKKWSGTYYSWNDYGADLKFTSVKSDHSIEAVFTFYSLDSDASDHLGSYKMKGTYDPETLHIRLDGTEWIDKPSGYSFLNINGYLCVDNNSIVGSSDSFHVFADSVVQHIKNSPTVCDELLYLTDTQVKELQTAIAKIQKKHGVGTVLLLTNTNKDTWEYLRTYVNRENKKLQLGEIGAFCLNSTGDTQSGWWGDVLDDFHPYDDDEVCAFYYSQQYDKAFQAYLYALNRFLGGKDSDLTFSW